MATNFFTESIIKGLTSPQKYIPDSVYYDDNQGSIYFEELLLNPDYYPAHCENEILNTHSENITNYLPQNVTVADLGAGEGSKTKLILNALNKAGKLKAYIPIDISHRYLVNISREFKKMFPQIDILPVEADYYSAMQKISTEKNLFLLFLGNSFGNLDKNEQQEFLKFIHSYTKPGDFLLLGLDLKKDEKILHRAYRETCRNWCFYLFERINRELQADFDKNLFEYHTEYSAETGEYKWFFISKTTHTVYLAATGTEIEFKEDEKIFIGRSFKFDEAEIIKMAQNAGLEITDIFYDSKKYFADFLLKHL